jgi:molybdopterin-containing oxidoreductase family iron-sulfur binding subunit
MRRRDFLKMMGVASTASLTTSCGLNKNTEKLIPYLVPPEEEILPGTAVYHNTSCTECSANCGASAKIREKLINNEYMRVPIKLDGIEQHPVNDGALCVRGQSSITRLYHPQRIKNPLIKSADGEFVEASWEEAFISILKALESSDLNQTRNVYLSGRTTGSLVDLLDDNCRRMGIEKLPDYEFYSHTNLREANRVLFGFDEIPYYKIEDCDFLLSVGADLFETFVSPVSYAKQFARARKAGHFSFYHVEPHVSTTGFRANERFAVKAGSEAYLLVYLLRSLAGKAKNSLSAQLLGSLPNPSLAETAEKTGLEPEDVSKLVDEFGKAQNPLLIVGGVSTSNRNGLETAIVAGLIQWAMGMIGSVIDFSRAENLGGVGSLQDMEKLSTRLNDGEIGVIFLSDVDPSRTLPPSIPFLENLSGAKFRVAFSLLMNETVEACDVVLPLSHSLESWGDAESRRGILNLIQPVMEPLYNTITVGDIFIELSLRKIGASDEPTFQEYLFRKWRERFGRAKIEELLDRGYLEETVSSRRVALNSRSARSALAQFDLQEPVSEPVLFVAPSLRSYDGRSRALPLLEEIPDPLSAISYGQWISISRATAVGLRIEDHDEIELTAGDRTLKLPVRLQPGLREDVFMIQRDLVKDILLQIDSATGDHISFVDGVSFRKTGLMIAFPILTGQSLEHENAARRNDLHAGKEEHSPDEHGERLPDMYPFHEHKDYRWAMAIDLDLCTGCSACVAACYVENNIPITGEKEHLKGREMSWVRIEARYGSEGNATFQPMMCQHCGNASCEPVCPVYATYHTEEGLNAQIYNRCVGTRYCSNNCPFKVRRFNWFDYPREEPLNLMLNPDVFVRGSGVMEKCTFCVQRIRLAKDHAKDEGRKVADGEIRTACQQTCPANAIVFGNLLDPESEVAKLAANGGYVELEELNTKPAVTYLRKTEA